VSRITEYAGQEVEYYWQDHKSHQQERARVIAVEFIRRLVQHILPKGFQRVRYYGLHAVCVRQKIGETVRKAIGAALQMAFYFGEAILQKLGWRAKIKKKLGRDPTRCEGCGEEMILWKVWTPTHGVVY
jgi:Putative transposase